MVYLAVCQFFRVPSLPLHWFLYLQVIQVIHDLIPKVFPYLHFLVSLFPIPLHSDISFFFLFLCVSPQFLLLPYLKFSVCTSFLLHIAYCAFLFIYNCSSYISQPLFLMCLKFSIPYILISLYVHSFTLLYISLYQHLLSAPNCSCLTVIHMSVCTLFCPTASHFTTALLPLSTSQFLCL